jgi:hypothetical protein
MTALALSTWVLASCGAVAAVAAMLAKVLGHISGIWTSRLFAMAYLFMGLSALLFIIRGFADPGQASP